MNYKHYYVKSNEFGKRIKYEDAPREVVIAVKDPCTFENPPPGSNCPPNEYEIAPYKFKNTAIDMAGDLTEEMNTKSENMILGTNDNRDVLQYNKDRYTNDLVERQSMASRNDAAIATRYSDGLGGAKNKKKHRFRTKRRRSASRRKASRRKASRRNAPRRRTGKK